MVELFSSRALRRWLPWLLIVLAALLLPVLLPPFRLNLLGRFLALGIAALGIDLIWGFTGLLSLGQGIFFALGGYALGMHLQLQALQPGQLPEFFSLYGVKALPAFWQPFNSGLFTFFAIWVIPAAVACVLGYLVFRNRIKGVYFSILTQAALLVFFNFFNGQQKLINGTNGLKTDTARIFGQLVGSDGMQRNLFWLTLLLAIGAFLLCRWLIRGRFGDALIAIRDDEPRLRFTGYNPTAYKTMVFAVAGALAGISGALYTVQSGIVSPQYMAVPFSIEMVIWVAVGGRGTLIGALLGAFLCMYCYQKSVLIVATSALGAFGVVAASAFLLAHADVRHTLHHARAPTARPPLPEVSLLSLSRRSPSIPARRRASSVLCAWVIR
jgi:urea transport system permease protein